MNPQELSISFDILYNNIASNQAPGLSEYEKSLILTTAQEEVVVNVYSGRNNYGESFESTEEMRRYLNKLIKVKKYVTADKINITDPSTINYIKPPDSFECSLYKLENDVAYITTEQVTYDSGAPSCYSEKDAFVYPITQDEYNRVIGNPFRGPTQYKAIRLDLGDNEFTSSTDSTPPVTTKTVSQVIEIISKFPVREYTMTYLSLPEPIILETITDQDLYIRGKGSDPQGCNLSPLLCNIIIERAVQLAIQTMNRK